jgi:phosphate transport system permease protein
MDDVLYNKVLRLQSGVIYGLCVLFTVIILAILSLVTGFLLVKGLASMNLHLFTMLPVDNPDDPAYPGGFKHSIIGSLLLIAMASSVGVPIGMLTGVYLSEYGSNSLLAAPTRFVCDVLTGVPSIVVGIVGYELIVKPFGLYGYAGATALGFIMVPIVARTTEEMLKLVPNSYREASVALGATKAYTILKVILPAATGSVVTGIMLAVARVAGETAPLIFTVFGYDSLRVDPREKLPAITLQIFKWTGEGTVKQQGAAWAGMLVLLLLIFLLNIGIRFFARSVQLRSV